MTLDKSAVEQLAQGCHNLTLTASNKITSHTVSTDLELCLLQPVEGLQAFIDAEEGECPDSSDLIINVSFEQGGPVQLLFSLNGAKDSISETREMLSGSSQAFTFSSPLEGLLGKAVIKLKLYN